MLTDFSEPWLYRLTSDVFYSYDCNTDLKGDVQSAIAEDLNVHSRYSIVLVIHVYGFLKLKGLKRKGRWLVDDQGLRWEIWKRLFQLLNFSRVPLSKLDLKTEKHPVESYVSKRKEFSNHNLITEEHTTRR